jgi:hypothetical protein
VIGVLKKYILKQINLFIGSKIERISLYICVARYYLSLNLFTTNRSRSCINALISAPQRPFLGGDDVNDT